MIENATSPTAMAGEVAFVAGCVLPGRPMIDDDPRALAAMIDDDLLLPVIADGRLGFPGMHDDAGVLAAVDDHDLLLPVIADGPLGFTGMYDDARVLTAMIDDNFLLPVIADGRLGFPGMHDDAGALAAVIDDDRLLLSVIPDAPANFTTLAFLVSFYLFFDRTGRR